MSEYYQLSSEEVLQRVNGSQEPLTSAQVREHQEKYGSNQLIEGKKKTIFSIFLEQYKDFLVIILIIAAIVSGLLKDVESAIVILVVITMNAILGTVQTMKAEQSLDSLKKLSGPEAKVLREGNVVQIPSAEVTIGDIVILDAGDYIPADGRILECASLKVDESALTGESLGVEKGIEAIRGEVPIGDRYNMVYSGTFATYGRASFIATGIGMDTEVGKIAKLLNTTSEKRTPLQISLDQFGKKLSIIILIFCAALFGIQVLRGGDIGDAFLFAVALAVAAIPEALSSIVTIVLSFGTQKMAKEHAIIRKLQAVEGLGSVSVICSDKTGTLTQNRMTVEDYYVDGTRIHADQIDVSDPQQSMLLSLNATYGDEYVFGGSDAKNTPFTLETDANGNQTLYYRGVDVTDGDVFKLDELSKDSHYIDLGFGLEVDGMSQYDIDAASAFNTSLPGINLVGYGKDEDGDPKNMIILAGQIADLLEAEDFDYDRYKELVGKFEDGRNDLLSEVTILGTQTEFLTNTEERLENNKIQIAEDYDNVVNVDMAEAIMDFSWAQYVYNASLKVGNSILTPSFIDYMR